MQVAFLLSMKKIYSDNSDQKGLKTRETIKDLKKRFLEYYSQLPNQRLAADNIGRNEDTIILWKKNDTDFDKKVLRARAEWALSNCQRVKSAEWLLERVLNDHFGEKKEKEDIGVNHELDAALDRLAKLFPQSH